MPRETLTKLVTLPAGIEPQFDPRIFGLFFSIFTVGYATIGILLQNRRKRQEQHKNYRKNVLKLDN